MSEAFVFRIRLFQRETAPGQFPASAKLKSPRLTFFKVLFFSCAKNFSKRTRKKKKKKEKKICEKRSSRLDIPLSYRPPHILHLHILPPTLFSSFLIPCIKLAPSGVFFAIFHCEKFQIAEINERRLLRGYIRPFERTPSEEQTRTFINKSIATKITYQKNTHIKEYSLTWLRNTVMKYACKQLFAH
ncbi:hypothetical protein PUN28_009676 [Cardiocondyla obscurior]|uniref:Uncharacterized protein n=1 Tax=Cardiocondyla obscurior TaxID=286306 RepID=A0AAW2FX24_9HYME